MSLSSWPASRWADEGTGQVWRVPLNGEPQVWLGLNGGSWDSFAVGGECSTLTWE